MQPDERAAGKKRLISLGRAAVIVNQINATTGAVDKYNVQFFMLTVNSHMHLNLKIRIAGGGPDW